MSYLKLISYYFAIFPVFGAREAIDPATFENFKITGLLRGARKDGRAIARKDRVKFYLN